MQTTESPSDIPKRGARAKDLKSMTMWWEGPEFLKRPMSDWPEQLHIRKTEEAAAEERTVEEISKAIIL